MGSGGSGQANRFEEEEQGEAEEAKEGGIVTPQKPAMTAAIQQVVLEAQQKAGEERKSSLLLQL